MLSSVKLYGTKEPAPKSHFLKSGLLTAIYRYGAIRYISHGSAEIIRMIFFAVRDKNWLTIEPRILRERFSKSRHGIVITTENRYQEYGIDFKAQIKIRIMGDNRLTAEIKGVALTTFLKNRIGFCVLHPVETCSGLECRIFHPDGSSTFGKFPALVTPHQPFRNIRAMQVKYPENKNVLIRFSGDIFETEDQRNWTDASYKTYSTPLEQPFPVTVARGSSLHQKIELTLDSPPVPKIKGREETAFHVESKVLGIIPEIGIGSCSGLKPVSPSEGTIIRKIRFSHLRGELHLFDTQWEKKYRKLADESQRTGLPLELWLLFGQNPKSELDIFLRIFRQLRVSLKRIGILSQAEKTTPPDLILQIISMIRRAFPGIPTGGGTNCNFAELNRAGRFTEDVDFLSFAVHPQEHAHDDMSLIENTLAQKYVMESAAILNPGKPVIVSPVTLQRRFNANNGNYETPDDIPGNIDPRQMSLFGAVWTVGSLKYLIESGAESITYYETVGERGLCMGERSSEWPLYFHAKKGMIFPIYHVFRFLLQNTRHSVVHSYSNKPLIINGFTIASEDHGIIFLSNMTLRREKVVLRGILQYRLLFQMHAGNFNSITQLGISEENNDFSGFGSYSGPLTLRPYETVVLQYDLLPGGHMVL